MSVRNLGSIVWSDPLAWTEAMKGPSWKRLIQQEQANFNTLLGNYIDTSEVHAIEGELQSVTEANNGPPLILFGSVEVFDTEKHSVKWKWVGQQESQSVNDVAIDDQGNVWDVLDTGEGSERYSIRFWKKGDSKPTWALDNVGPYVVVLQNKCFYLEAINSLWYHRMCSVNALTGKDRKVLYEEKDPKYNLSLVKAENFTGYLVRENSGFQEAFYFFNETLKSLKQAGFFVLGGGAPNDYFATEGRGTDSWKGYGPRLSQWILPDPKQFGIPESVWPGEYLLVTRKQGIRYLWYCSTLVEPKCVYEGISQIKLNVYALHYQNKVALLKVMTPGMATYHCEFSYRTLRCQPPTFPPYGKAQLCFTHPDQGTTVPYVLVSPMRKPKSLLVVGYGAYGEPTALSTSRWYPLLLREWAVVFALVRGGGDDTMKWANAARTFRRENSIKDFEAVIRAARNKLGIPAKQTCVYGRSAGGILVGGAAVRQKHASLFGGLYAEVPYLDILRTTTNPRLPLTVLEYEEFGNPRKKVEDLIALSRISPMEGLPEGGLPELFALIRTGENDKEVFAYEPVKWILRARGKNKKDTRKILAFGDGQGHFVSGSSGLQQRATDLAFLLAWRKDIQFRI